MIVKALLAALGLRVMPDLHNQAVHDARNAKAALMAGHARIVRLSAVADRAAAAGDTRRTALFVDKQSEVRSALDALARRLD